jgi:hypothetical protein
VYQLGDALAQTAGSSALFLRVIMHHRPDRSENLALVKLRRDRQGTRAGGRVMSGMTSVVIVESAGAPAKTR